MPPPIFGERWTVNGAWLCCGAVRSWQQIGFDRDFVANMIFLFFMSGFVPGLNPRPTFGEVVVDADGFCDEAAHLLEDWAGLVGAVEGLGSECLFGYEAGIDELPNFALNGAQGDAGLAGKLAEVERLAYMAVEHGEDGTARAAEEGFGEDGGCTRFGVRRTRKGYRGARGAGRGVDSPVPKGEGPGPPA